MKLKHYLMPTLLMYVSSHAIAGTMGPVVQDNIFDGLYGGAMIGVDQFILNTSSSRTETFPAVYAADAGIKSSYSANALNYNVMGAFYIGYGQFIQQSRYYLGGEAFLDLATRQKTSTSTLSGQGNDTTRDTVSVDFNTLNSAFSTKLNIPEFALDLKPGLMVDLSTMVYGRVGMAFNTLKVTEQDNNSYVNVNYPDLSKTTNYTLSNSRSQVSLRLGLGAERTIMKNLSVTADYIYTSYNGLTLSGTGTTYGQSPDGGAAIIRNGFSRTFTSNPYTNAVMFGLKYHYH